MIQSVHSDPLVSRKAFLHVGHSNSLALIVEDELPVFFRDIRRDMELKSAGSDRYEQVRPEGMPLSEPTDAASERLAQEFARTLQFYGRSTTGRDTVAQIIVSAGGLDVRLLQSVLEAQTGIPTVLATPGPNATISSRDRRGKDLREQWSQLALAAAVAIPKRISRQAQLVTIPGRLARTFSGRRLAAAAIVLYAAALMAWWVHLGTRIDKLSAQRASLAGIKQGLEGQLQSRRASYASRRDLQERAALLLRMKEQGVFAANLLAAANNERPSQVQFESISLDTGDRTYRLALSGLVPGTDPRNAVHVLDEYITNLRGTGLFDAVYFDKPVPQIASSPEPKEPPSSSETKGKETGEGETKPAKGAEESRKSAFTFTLRAESATPWRGEGRP